jgi:hypothetical protein
LKRFFQKENVPFMFELDTYKVYTLIGDNWAEVVDEDLKHTIRFGTVEISTAEAQSMERRNLKPVPLSLADPPESKNQAI